MNDSSRTLSLTDVVSLQKTCPEEERPIN